MNNFTARAMQIASMNKDQVQTLHDVENRVGRGMINYNIQEMLGLPSLKSYFNLPEDDGDLSRHMAKIEADMVKANLFKTEQGGLLSYGNLEGLHQFDWGVFNNKAEITWNYGGSMGKNRLLDKFGLGLMLTMALNGPRLG